MSTDPRRPRMLRAFLRGAALVAIVVVVASLVLRFTVRDRVPGLQVVFYATPLGLDSAAAIVAALIAWRFASRRALVAAAALAVVTSALYVSREFFWNEPRPRGSLRGAFWNVAYGSATWPKIAETVRGFDADVVWLTEIAADDAEGERLLREALPGWKTARSKGGIFVLSRGDVSLVETQKLRHGNWEARFHVTVDGRSFEAVQIDLGSDPLNHRLPALAHVLDDAKSLAAAGPLLVLGDFNTPRDSAGFDGFRGPLANAFETAGRGLDATWPVPVPVLSCDQVWAGGGLAIRTCETPWTGRSDHLPVVFTFDLPR